MLLVVLLLNKPTKAGLFNSQGMNLPSQSQTSYPEIRLVYADQDFFFQNHHRPRQIDPGFVGAFRPAIFQ